ncbi:MAG: hypothetical protein ACOYNI_06365 [Acidimicrobiia bacterium]
MTSAVAQSSSSKGRGVAWAGTRLAGLVVGVTFMLMIFVAVFLGSLYLAGTIVASGHGGAITRIEKNRAEAQANRTFDQMVQSTDPAVKQAGTQVTKKSGKFVVTRAYIIPVLARGNIEQRFSQFSGVKATWTTDVDAQVGFGDLRQRIPEAYHGLVLTTTI